MIQKCLLHISEFWFTLYSYFRSVFSEQRHRPEKGSNTHPASPAELSSPHSPDGVQMRYVPRRFARVLANPRCNHTSQLGKRTTKMVKNARARYISASALSELTSSGTGPTPLTKSQTTPKAWKRLSRKVRIPNLVPVMFESGFQVLQLHNHHN